MIAEAAPAPLPIVTLALAGAGLPVLVWLGWRARCGRGWFASHPAPIVGDRDLVFPLALAGRSVGADGLLVSVHPDPANALSGNGSQLDPAGLMALMDSLGIPSLRDEIDRIDRQLVKLVARRLHSSVEIARIKDKTGLAMRSPDREEELIQEAREDATLEGIDPGYVEELMRLVLEHSRAAQQRAIGER